MLTKAVYHSSFSATVKSRHSKCTKQNDSSHVDRARLRQAWVRDIAMFSEMIQTNCFHAGEGIYPASYSVYDYNP